MVHHKKMQGASAWRPGTGKKTPFLYPCCTRDVSPQQRGAAGQCEAQHTEVSSEADFIDLLNKNR
jgi:hypothetical protein